MKFVHSIWNYSPPSIACAASALAPVFDELAEKSARESRAS
jgi:hypothetical protein